MTAKTGLRFRLGPSDFFRILVRERESETLTAEQPPNTFAGIGTNAGAMRGMIKKQRQTKLLADAVNHG